MINQDVAYNIVRATKGVSENHTILYDEEYYYLLYSDSSYLRFVNPYDLLNFLCNRSRSILDSVIKDYINSLERLEEEEEEEEEDC